MLKLALLSLWRALSGNPARLRHSRVLLAGIQEKQNN